MRKNIFKILLMLSIVFLNIGCDQSTKFIAKSYLKDIDKIEVINGIFVLQYAENDGGFLSIFSHLPDLVRQILLFAIPIPVIIFLCFYIMFSKKIKNLQIIGFSFIIGGGVSNLIDRLLYEGFVTDFMIVGIGKLRSGILNFADLAIVAGFIILIFAFKKTKPEHIEETQ